MFRLLSSSVKKNIHKYYKFLPAIACKRFLEVYILNCSFAIKYIFLLKVFSSVSNLIKIYINLFKDIFDQHWVVYKKCFSYEWVFPTKIITANRTQMWFYHHLHSSSGLTKSPSIVYAAWPCLVFLRVGTSSVFLFFKFALDVVSSFPCFFLLFWFNLH